MTDHVVTAGQSDHVRDLLSGYLNGDSDDAERRAVEEHLETCEPCRADLSTLRLTVTALRQLPAVARRRDFSIAPPPLRRPSSIAWLRLTSGALAALVAILIGFRLLVQPTPLPRASSPVPPAVRPLAPLSAVVPTAAPAAAPAAANVPASAPPAPAAAAPKPPAENEPKASGSSGAAPTGSSAVVSTSRVMAVATTPTPTPYRRPASAPVAPSSEGAYPSGQSVMSPAPRDEAYPSPATAPNPGVSDSGYPSPGLSTGGAPTAPDATSYPPPLTVVESPALAVLPIATPLAAPQTAARESTWFTPALGILGGLVLATAVVLWAIGRRSP